MNYGLTIINYYKFKLYYKLWYIVLSINQLMNMFDWAIVSK